MFELPSKGKAKEFVEAVAAGTCSNRDLAAKPRTLPPNFVWKTTSDRPLP